jgi:hypothetical protein
MAFLINTLNTLDTLNILNTLDTLEVKSLKGIKGLKNHPPLFMIPLIFLRKMWVNQVNNVNHDDCFIAMIATHIWGQQ